MKQFKITIDEKLVEVEDLNTKNVVRMEPTPGRPDYVDACVFRNEVELDTSETLHKDDAMANVLFSLGLLDPFQN